MRHLVIAAHPSAKSFNRGVVETYVSARAELAIVRPGSRCTCTA